MDKYDEEIKELTQLCKESGDFCPIEDRWADPLCTELFKRVASTKELTHIGGRMVGCLTQIKGFPCAYIAAPNNEYDFRLTKEIQEDERIPTTVWGITLEHLPIFAEWQRKIDSLRKSITNG